MSVLTKTQAARREKTLLAAFLLSVWAPLTTGIAVVLSQSSTQVADFIRRTVELVALFVSWQVFRYFERNNRVCPEAKARVERLASRSVSAAIGVSGLVMVVLAVSRHSSFEPGGNVFLGLTIAVLGLVTNTWFWRRYSRMNGEQYNPVIAAQCHLYSAKCFVDLCVITALAAIAIDAAHPATRYIDVLGSVMVALYLLWSSYNTLRSAQLDAAATDRHD